LYAGSPVELPPPPQQQPSQGECFVGRDDLFARLVIRVGSGGASDAPRPVIVISQACDGLDGVGKSAAARELCRRQREHFSGGVFCISGLSTVSLHNGYHDVATQLSLRFDFLKQNAARDAVFRWMRTRDGWLLVVDDVDSPECVAALLPPADARGHVVCTTRASTDTLRRCGVLRSDADEPVVLEGLDATASAALLCQLCGCSVESLSDAERSAARRLCVDELAGVPLAIELAAAYMRGRRVGVVDYLVLYQTQCRSFTESRERSGDGVPDSDDKCRRSVQTTSELSLRSLSPRHSRLLWLLCGLGGVDVPFDVLLACVMALPTDDELRQTVFGVGAAADASAPVAADSSAGAACESLLHDLCQTALVKRTASHTAATSMHRSVRAAVWDAAPADVREVAACRCMHVLAMCLDGAVSASPRRQASGVAAASATSLHSWLTRADAAWTLHEGCVSATASPPLLRASVRLAEATAAALELAAQLDRAEALRRLAVQLLRRLHGEGVDDPSIEAALSNHAAVLLEQGNAAEAVTLCRESLATMQRMYGSEPQSIQLDDGVTLRTACRTSMTLARAQQAQDRITEAVRTLRLSLTMTQQLHRGTQAEHADVAMALSDLAAALHKQGKLEEATRLHRDALAMWRRLVGHDRDDANVAAALSDLAEVLHSQCEVEESTRLHRESLAMLRRLHGADADHRSVATAQSNLANVLRVQGQLSESARLLREALAMLQRLYGDDAYHRDIATILSNLATVVGAQGDLAASARLHRDALAMKQRLYGQGADHRVVATSLSNLAGVLHTQGELEESTRLYREALAMDRRLSGADADSEGIATLMSNLAAVLHAQGKMAEAARLLRDALAMCRRLYGEGKDHAIVATALSNLAGVLRAKGDVAEAARLQDETLAMMRRLAGGDATDDIGVATALSFQASELGRQGDLVGSARLQRESLSMLRRIYGADTDHPHVAMALCNVADATFALGDLAESARLHRKSLAMARRLFGAKADHAIIATTLSNLATVVGAQGNLEKSGRLQRESLAMTRRLHGADVDHEAVATSLGNLANVVQQQGDLAEAARLFCESLAMWRRLLGADSDHDHPSIAMTLCNLAVVRSAQGDMLAALRLERDALAMRRRLHGNDADHPDVATSLASLAAVLSHVRWPGDLAESALRLRESLAMSRRLYGETASHPDVVARLRSLSDVLMEQGAVLEGVLRLSESVTMAKTLT
jgi:tetratricopeptide (TPR) repeat protein